MTTNTTKEVKAAAKAQKESAQPSRNYEERALHLGAVIVLIALAYNGAFHFLQTVGNSSIKDTVWKIVAGVIVVLLVIVTAKKK